MMLESLKLYDTSRPVTAGYNIMEAVIQVIAKTLKKYNASQIFDRWRPSWI